MSDISVVAAFDTNPDDCTKPEPQPSASPSSGPACGDPDSADSTGKPRTNRKPKRGRPPALGDTKRREVCALVSAGGSVEWAAMYVGCAASTVYRLARRDPQFNDKLRQAALAAQLYPLNALRKASDTHWRAAAWLLERTNPNQFVRRRIDVLTRRSFVQFYQTFYEMLMDEKIEPEIVDRVRKRIETECRTFLVNLRP